MSPTLSPGGRGTAQAAFTLIELLTVIAIIGVLAGITFGVVKGVQNRAAISQARTELATLAQALEAYKRQYGDYPQTGQSAVTDPSTADPTTTSVEGRLFNALLGKVGPRLDAIQGKQFLEASKFTLKNTNLPTPGNDTSVANGFVDPWGQVYVYHYRTRTAPGDWVNSSYILATAGPDGKLGISVNNKGVLTESNGAEAADNLYANK